MLHGRAARGEVRRWAETRYQPVMQIRFVPGPGPTVSSASVMSPDSGCCCFWFCFPSYPAPNPKRHEDGASGPWA